jgi:hypothetical protein
MNKYTRIGNYEDYVTNSDNDPVFQLSEIILIRACALAELNGVNQESVDRLNEIRNRVLIIRIKRPYLKPYPDLNLELLI